MAGIFKAIGGGNSHACTSLEKYLTKLEKVNENEMIGINCDPATFNDDFVFDRAKYSIDKNARAYLHYSLSYRDTDGLSNEEILEQAKKLVEGIDKFKGHRIAIICHSDKEHHPHVHIVVNAVNSNTGKKLAFNRMDLAKTKETLMELDKENGLEPEQKTHRGIRNQSMKAYKMIEKGEKGDKSVWKVVIKNAVIENVAKSVSKDDFISRMEKQGFSVEWAENKKNITISDINRNKRRLSNIEKEYPEYEGKLTKEELEKTFSLNMLKKEISLDKLKGEYKVKSLKEFEKEKQNKNIWKEEVKKKTRKREGMEF